MGWNFTARRPSLVLLLAAALAGLLALLATLQYRWLGQVSAGERERMQTTLRLSTARFTEDFDRELGRVYFGLQSDAAPLRAGDWTDFAARYDRWQRNAPAPQLVRAVYLLDQTGRATDARLLRYDAAARRFTPVAWPAEFASLQRQLAALPEVRAAGPGGESFTPLPPLAGDVPAVIIPVTNDDPLRLSAPAAPLLVRSFVAPATHLVAVLDAAYIRQELLPTLAARYFASGSAGLAYRLAIYSRAAPRRLVYQSNPDGPAPQTGDVQAGLFNLHFDEADVFMTAADVQSTTPLDGAAARVSKRNLSLRIFRRTENGTAAPGARARSMGSAPDGGDWQLVVAHPDGSLDAAVARGRRRSLAVSFGVLLLLAASTGLLVVSAHRAQAVARQQLAFVAGVTHELRTPLAVICAAGENLADGVIAERGQVQRYGALIRGEGRRLGAMVEQVLEFAGAQRGRRPLELRPVAVADLIARALAACERPTEAAAYAIEQHVAPDLPPVLADEAALLRALQNLLSNAQKYGGARRWVGVSARMGAGAHRREVQITVADQGLGIEPAELAHVFEPFYRGREVRAAQIHGNGLGLSLVKDIVEAHGGRVTVTSAPGAGSAFTLHLPALAATNAPAQSGRSARGADRSNA